MGGVIVGSVSPGPATRSDVFLLSKAPSRPGVPLSPTANPDPLYFLVCEPNCNQSGQYFKKPSK